MATLYDLAMQYLRQGLPDISGIFPATTTPPPAITDPIDGGDVQRLLPVMPQRNGGDGFNPYNIRPGDSSIRTPNQYSPYAYNQAMRNTKTFGQTVGPNPDLYYAPPTGIQQLMSKIPTPFGFIRKGLDALADKLPVNRRGILENELLGGGIMLDDIGRIVTNNYNTPEGIMAGYNAAKLSSESFDKRRETVANTLKEKYGMSDEDIEAAIAGEYEGDAPINRITGKPTDLINKLDLFNKSQNLLNKRSSMADIIYNRKLEEKRIADIPKEVRQFTQPTRTQREAIARDNRGDSRSGGGGGFSDVGAGSSSRGAGKGGGYDAGNFCFDPSTPIQMADGSTKEIKNIQLGDDTKGGEVTGVFQFKASDEIHDYKGVTVAGSHYVKEDGKFIMVKDSPLSVKIDKIPVVYSLDTTGRRIFINNIEFADYNGDGIAKGFLENAGVDLAGFDKEVLRQVEHRLI